MKKGLLLFLGMLMMVSTVEATEGKIANSINKGYYNYYGAKPIKFMERGIKFYVFPNGDVDFNTRTRTRAQYYYRNGRRYSKRIPHRGVSIDRDYFGRVRRVGNVFINYNRFGNVSRVGSVFIDYHRGRRLKRVGGLTIRYDRYGGVRYFGHVKPQFGIGFGFNDFYFDGHIYDYDDDFFYGDDFYEDYEDYGEDDDYYYYKSKNGKALKKVAHKGYKKGKIIKRKKLKKFDDDDYDDDDDDYKERKRRR